MRLFYLSVSVSFHLLKIKKCHSCILYISAYRKTKNKYLCNRDPENNKKCSVIPENMQELFFNKTKESFHVYI